MRRTVLVFGVISGCIISLMMLVSVMFNDAIGFDRAEVIGYTSMVLAFLLVFFGIRSYRDNVAGGSVSFGRAFSVGALIAVVASLFYVATWEFVYYRITPDFVEKYQAHIIEKARQDGESEEAIAKRRAELARYAELYSNPAINAAVTFLEPLPVALIMTLVSAGVLSRRRHGVGSDGMMPATRTSS
jgi:hypothetical protein